MKRSSSLAIVLLAVLLAACTGGPAGTPAASDSPSPAPSNPPGSAPTSTHPPTPTPSPAPATSPSGIGANVAVVRIEQTGGMLPPWEMLRWYPSVVLYSDGRVIMQGPQIEIYPGPALPNLQVTHLTQHGVEQILAWAAEAGLQGEDRQLGELLLDSGVTLFTVVTADGAHHTSVTDMAGDDPEIAALRKFQDIVVNARAWVANDVIGDDEPYAFDRLRLISFPADLQGQPDPQLSSELDWPLDQPLATIGDPISEPESYRCAELAGDDLAQMLPLFGQANQLTVWRSDDELYQLHLRPLLPDEEACPGV